MEEALEPVVPNDISISGWELVAVITAQDREGGGWRRKGTPASATIRVLSVSCVEPFIPWGHCPATVDVVVVPWKGRWTDFLAPGPARPIGPVAGSRGNVAAKGWCTHVCDRTKLQGQGPVTWEGLHSHHEYPMDTGGMLGGAQHGIANTTATG